MLHEIVNAINEEEALEKIYVSENMKKLLTDSEGQIEACVNDGGYCLICGSCPDNMNHSHLGDEMTSEKWKEYIDTVLKWGGPTNGRKVSAYRMSKDWNF